MKTSMLWSVLGLFILTACNTASTVASPDTGQVTQTVTATEFTSAATQALQEGSITFQRNGGFAGVSEQWIIFLDGHIENLEGERQQVDSEDMHTLFEIIQAEGFFELADSYVPLDTCCDRFTYTISVSIGDKNKSVSTIDASPTQPAQLQNIIRAINDLLFTP